MDRPDNLRECLLEAQVRGFLGPGDVDAHLAHSLAFCRLVAELLGGGADGRVLVDLGTGGGVPGLVLAQVLPNLRVKLVESSARRAGWLEESLRGLRLSGHAEVVHTRAESFAQDPVHRYGSDLVTARGFGRPAVVVECGAPLLRLGGRLIVSEPPGSREERWPVARLSELGLGAADTVLREGFSFSLLTLEQLTPRNYPRRVGVPAKRPLF